MLNGFLQNGKCYQDINSAYTDYAGTVPMPVSSPLLYVQKTYNVFSVYGSLKGHFQFDYFTVLPSGAFIYRNTVSISEPVFPVCDPIKPFQDGAFFGMIIATAFISVSLVAVMRRAL